MLQDFFMDFLQKKSKQPGALKAIIKFLDSRHGAGHIPLS